MTAAAEADNNGDDKNGKIPGFDRRGGERKEKGGIRKKVGVRKRRG